MNKVVVLGSLNMDMVLKVDHIVKVGETILSKSFEKIPGGKGANQAVAARRSGAEVTMLGKIGKDENGQILVDELNKDGINTSEITISENESTGMAMIMVGDTGNNSIVVIPASNMDIKDEVTKWESSILNGDILITQLETPEKAAIEAFKFAKNNGKVTILNPAPAKQISDELLKYTDIIIPNETEAETLTGVKVEDLETAKDAAKVFNEKGVEYVIITLGSKGAAVIGKEEAEVIPAFKVNAIDTTAAGDSFIGGLSSKLDCKNLNLENIKKAVLFGNRVSSISVTRKGAQPSIPYLKEVKELYGEV
ncbi:ribokinase [Clostridium cavendishii DSM 21758]|uniref:Ribokinase n=1 Tax=Clostridium cavendishii DSM 21758 TaxID=1121302 RepID=A0A1M6RUW0_9CLOT|nr:ribokinase [Clostridium cavendishii]SHK36246.1 ribokinase [Clostridium cavendishii DSM 21758]